MSPQVAKEIISYCSSCKRDVMHTIVAMKEDRIVRVLCRSCKKEHAFRRSPDNTTVGKRPAARPASGKPAPDVEDWRAEIGKLRGVAAKPYTMDGLFEQGQKLSHPTFGTGLVKELISHDKMAVLFETGIKVLVRGRPGETSGRRSE